MLPPPEKVLLPLLLASGLGVVAVAHAVPLKFSLDLGGPG